MHGPSHGIGLHTGQQAPGSNTLMYPGAQPMSGHPMLSQGDASAAPPPPDAPPAAEPAFPPCPLLVCPAPPAPDPSLTVRPPHAPSAAARIVRTHAASTRYRVA